MPQPEVRALLGRQGGEVLGLEHDAVRRLGLLAGRTRPGARRARRAVADRLDGLGAPRRGHHDIGQDRVAQRARRGPAIVGRLHQGPLDRRAQPRRRVGSQLGDGPRPLAHVLHQQRHRVAGRERHAAGEHLVGEHAQGVDVAAPVQLTLAHRLLGRHVGGRADGGAGRGEPRAGLHRAGDAEVGHHRAPGVAVEQDVVGLDVAVDHAALVRVVERVGDLAHQPPHLVHRQAPFPGQQPRQAPARDQRHHQPGHAVALAHVVDGHDVRVRQPRRSVGLAREPGPHRGVVRQVGRQHLEGDQPLEPPVPGAVHDRHAAAADLLQQLVVIARRGDDPVPERVRHRGRLWNSVGTP